MEREQTISLKLSFFFKFFIFFFSLFFIIPKVIPFPRNNNNKEKYYITPFSGKNESKKEEGVIEESIYILDQHPIHVEWGDFTENAHPNCIFKTKNLEEYQYVLGREPHPEIDEYIFFWGESELRTKFDCNKYCLHGIKFWYNNYSTGIVADIPRYSPSFIEELHKGEEDGEKKEKGRDILVSLSNCESKRFSYIKAWLKKVRMEFPQIGITLCGSCFGNDIDPECPKRSEIWTLKHLLWIQKHKFVIALENSVCHNYVTEKLMNAILTKTIPIINPDTSYLPWWISKFSDRFLTTESFFFRYPYFLMNNSMIEYKKMLFNQEEIEEIYRNVPGNLDNICRLINELEKNKSNFSKLKEKTRKEFPNCLRDCRINFGCNDHFIIPKEWKLK